MKSRAGFSLVELMVVVLIFGILSALGIMAYQRTVETEKAEIARGLTGAIAKANRAYMIDRSFAGLQGGLNACAPANCLEDSDPGNPNTNACQLINCNYLPDHNFNETRYNFFVVNGPLVPECAGLGAPAGVYASCSVRRAGASAPYSSWGYTVTRDGLVQGWPAGGPPGALP